MGGGRGLCASAAEQGGDSCDRAYGRPRTDVAGMKTGGGRGMGADEYEQLLKQQG